MGKKKGAVAAKARAKREARKRCHSDEAASNEAAPEPILPPDGQRVRRGLTNLGNTCFMASLLQCLNASDFSDELMKLRSKGLQALSSLLCTTFSGMRGLTDDKAPTKKGNNAYSPRPLWQRLVAKFPWYQGNRQQDAHEFFRTLIGAVADEKTTEEDAQQIAPKETCTGQCVADNFRGQTVGAVLCWGCNKVSMGLEPFLDLSLSLPALAAQRLGPLGVAAEPPQAHAEESDRADSDADEETCKADELEQARQRFIDASAECLANLPSELKGLFAQDAPPRGSKQKFLLQDCLKEFSVVEALDDQYNPAYNCCECKENAGKTYASRKMWLWPANLPPILAIHLKRWRLYEHGYDKSRASVEMPLELDLSESVMTSEQLKALKPHLSSGSESMREQVDSVEHMSHPVQYELFAVCVHEGPSMTKGHYYSYVNSGTLEKEDWHCINDAKVRSCMRAEVLKAEACIAFYRRIRAADTSSAPAKDDPRATVQGVSEDTSQPSTEAVSCATCTTDGVAPAEGVLHEACGIERGLMTTCQAMTSSQPSVDETSENDERSGRVGPGNDAPSSPCAPQAVAQVIPAVQGKLSGMALRVPTIDVPVVDLAAELEPASTSEGVCAETEGRSEDDTKDPAGHNDKSMKSGGICAETEGRSEDDTKDPTGHTDKAMTSEGVCVETESPSKDDTKDPVGYTVKAMTSEGVCAENEGPSKDDTKGPAGYTDKAMTSEGACVENEGPSKDDTKGPVGYTDKAMTSEGVCAENEGPSEDDTKDPVGYTDEAMTSEGVCPETEGLSEEDTKDATGHTDEAMTSRGICADTEGPSKNDTNDPTGHTDEAMTSGGICAETEGLSEEDTKDPTGHTAEALVSTDIDACPMSCTYDANPDIMSDPLS